MKLLIGFLLLFLPMGALWSQKYNHQDSLRGSIGKERAWWDVQKYSLSFEVSPSSKSIKGKNVILTHNHPSNTGLSDADYIFASKNDVAEFRAVGETKTFTIVRPKEGWPKDQIKFADDVRAAYRETGKLYSNLYQNDKITYEQYRDNWANKTMELIKLKTGVEYEYRRK
jgi:hypothetical protein